MSPDSLNRSISALREKIEDSPRNPEVIVTLPGLGYRYSPPTPHPQTS